MVRLPGHPLAGGEGTPTAQVTAQVTGEVQRLLLALDAEMSRQQLLDTLGMTHREHFRSAYLKPALDAGVVEMTLPDKPNSSNQRYRRTALGKLWLELHSGTHKAVGLKTLRNDPQEDVQHPIEYRPIALVETIERKKT